MAMLRPSRRQLSKWRREQRTRRAILLAALGLALAVVAILGFGYWRENVARAAEPAATVLGETITVAELMERVRPRLLALDAQARFYEAQGITQAATQLGLQRSRLPDQVLDSAIEEKLVRREADARGVVLPPEDVEARIRRNIAEQEAANQPQPTPTPSPTAAASADGTPTPTASPTPVPTLTADAFETAYLAFLARTNLTDQAYRALVKAEVDKESLRKSFASDIPAAEEQAHVRHILVDNQDSLQQAQRRLADGAPFDQVARELSTDTGSRDKGGDLGWFGRGVMNAPFEQAALSQPIGLIGEPIESPNGTHIIQVLERDSARPLSEEQVQQRASQAYQAWYAGRRDSSDVDRQLTPERQAWILRQLGTRRAA